MSFLSKHLALEGNIRVLAMQLLVSQIGLGMVMVIWQPYILSQGFSVVELGFVQSVSNLASAAGLFSWGYLSDRYGRKPVVVAATGCRTLSVAALMLSGNLIFLYLFAFLSGFSALWFMANPARSSLIAESVSDKRRATAYSTLLAIGQTVNTVMSSAGGYAAVVLGYTPIFVVALVGDVIGIVFLIFGIKETRKPDVKPPSSLGKKLRGILVPEKELLPLYTVMALMGVSYGVGYSVFYGILVKSFGYTTIQLGIISTVFSLSWGLFSIPGGKLSEKFGGNRIMMLSSLFSLITTAGLILFQSFPALLIFSVTNALDPCLWAPNWPGFISERTTPAKRSQIFGKLDAYGRFASIPAPWIGGVIYEFYGYTAPLLVHFALTLVWATLLFRVIRKPAPAHISL